MSRRHAILAAIGDDRCFYCGRDFTDRQRTVDHLVPLSKGGADALKNMVLACGSCNRAKGDMLWSKYLVTETFKRRLKAAQEERKPRLEVIRTLPKVPVAGNETDVDLGPAGGW